MYRYKLKDNARIWYVKDRDMKEDPYIYFSGENIEHWTHTKDDDGAIDLYWPKIEDPQDNVMDTVCSKCFYWYGTIEGEKVSQCPKCGNIDYY